MPREEFNLHGRFQADLRRALRAKLAAWKSGGGTDLDFARICLGEPGAVKLSKWLTGRTVIPYRVLVYLEEGPPGPRAGRRAGAEPPPVVVPTQIARKPDA